MFIFELWLEKYVNQQCPSPVLEDYCSAIVLQDVCTFFISLKLVYESNLGSTDPNYSIVTLLNVSLLVDLPRTCLFLFTVFLVL